MTKLLYISKEEQRRQWMEERLARGLNRGVEGNEKEARKLLASLRLQAASCGLFDYLEFLKGLELYWFPERNEKAKTYFFKALRLNKYRAIFFVGLGMSYESEDAWRTGQHYLEKALSIDPYNKLAYLLLLRNYTHQGKMHHANYVYEELLKIFGTSAYANKLMMDFYLKIGDHFNAMKFADNAVKQGKNYLDCLINMIEMSMRGRDYQRAYYNIKKTLEMLDKDFNTEKPGIGNIRAYCLVNAVICLTHLKEYMMAVVKADEFYQKFTSFNNVEADYCYVKSLYKQKAFDMARSAIKDIKLDYSNPRENCFVKNLRILQAKIYYKLELYEHAYEVIEKFKVFDNELLTMYGDILYNHKKEYEKALVHFAYMRKKGGNSLKLIQSIADCYTHTNNASRYAHLIKNDKPVLEAILKHLGIVSIERYENQKLRLISARTAMLKLCVNEAFCIAKNKHKYVNTNYMMRTADNLVIMLKLEHDPYAVKSSIKLLFQCSRIQELPSIMQNISDQSALSEERILSNAIWLMNNRYYKKAIEAFESLGIHSDYREINRAMIARAKSLWSKKKESLKPESGINERSKNRSTTSAIGARSKSILLETFSFLHERATDPDSRLRDCLYRMGKDLVSMFPSTAMFFIFIYSMILFFTALLTIC